MGKGLPVVEDKCRLLGSELHRGVVGAGLIAPRMDGGDTAEYPVVVNGTMRLPTYEPTGIRSKIASPTLVRMR